MSENKPTVLDFVNEWKDFEKAFRGAFDTPVDRHKFARPPVDIYAQDAVQRFHKLEEMVKELFPVGEPAPFQPVGTVDMQTPKSDNPDGVKWSMWALTHGTTLYAHIKDLTK